MENLKANSLRKRTSMALFTSLLSQVTEGAYSSLYAAGNAFQRVEKEFGAQGRGRKTWPFCLLSIVSTATLALRERGGQSAASSTFR